MTIAGLWRYGDWRHVATGCTSLVHIYNSMSAGVLVQLVKCSACELCWCDRTLSPLLSVEMATDTVDLVTMTNCPATNACDYGSHFSLQDCIPLCPVIPMCEKALTWQAEYRRHNTLANMGGLATHKLISGSPWAAVMDMFVCHRLEMTLLYT